MFGPKNGQQVPISTLRMRTWCQHLPIYLDGWIGRSVQQA